VIYEISRIYDIIARLQVFKKARSGIFLKTNAPRTNRYVCTPTPANSEIAAFCLPENLNPKSLQVVRTLTYTKDYDKLTTEAAKGAQHHRGRTKS
jgi:hypothetical protein